MANPLDWLTGMFSPRMDAFAPNLPPMKGPMADRTPLKPLPPMSGRTADRLPPTRPMDTSQITEPQDQRLLKEPFPIADFTFSDRKAHPDQFGDTMANLGERQKGTPWSKMAVAPPGSIPRMLSDTMPDTSNKMFYKGKDPEGRPIQSLFFAGNDASGKETKMDDRSIDNVLSMLTMSEEPGEGYRARYEDYARPRAGGGLAGVTYSYQEKGKGKRKAEDNPIGVQIFDTPDAQERGTRLPTKAHEAGHALATRGYGRAGDSMDAMLMGKKNVPEQGLAQIKQFNEPRVSDFKQYAPDHADYAGGDDENFAEAFRAYALDPGGFKLRFPAAAGALRSMVNTNPRTRGIMTLGQNKDKGIADTLSGLIG